MYHPSTHLSYHRERHADLVRKARESERAGAIVESRATERRSFLARLWEKRHAVKRVPEPKPV